MDRKLCALIYSQHSPACRKLIEHVKSLDYDLPKITGMTLLSADSSEARSKFAKSGITSVPTLVVMYFDGTIQRLENEEVYDWIAAVNAVVRSPAPVEVEEPPTIKEEPVPPIYPSKKDVMSAAERMREAREADEPKKQNVTKL